MCGEAPDMQLVDDGAPERAPQGLVTFPVVGRQVGDDALHGGAGVAIGPAAGHPVVAFRNRHREAVRVEQHRGRVVPQPGGRVEAAVHPPRVNLPGAYAGHEYVPEAGGAVVRRIQRDGAGRRRVVDVVEQQQVDLGGRARPDREVRAALARPGTERARAAGGGATRHRRHASRRRARLSGPCRTPTGNTKMEPSSSGVRIGPAGARTDVGPCQCSQPRGR